MNNAIEQAGWKVHWRLTESAGIMIYLVDYRGYRVLWEGSLPYVTIDHQREEELEAGVEGEEHNPRTTHGPFWLPMGPRSLIGDVRMTSFLGGFELAADFAAGPYRYTQMWRFHENGRMDPWLTIHGPGVHGAHTYHPHWRFDFDIDGATDDALERIEDGRWSRVAEEGWFPHSGDSDGQGYVWRQIDFGSGASVSIRPNAGEDAELFAVRYRGGEGVPMSPRNDTGTQPFPEAYIGAEPLDGQDVLLWYVGHVHYKISFPFTAGPSIQVSGF